MKHGHGVYRWATGDTYQGYFNRDKREGLGHYVWAEGGDYRGEWAADRMNGVGRLNKEGIDIIGEFHADHFVRPVDRNELTDPTHRNFILKD